MSKGPLLALDTSDTPLTVAVSFPDGAMASVSKKGIKQEDYLFPIIDRLLAKQGFALRDVGRVFVLRGPGRFTGIRIGLTLATVLSRLCGAETVAASTLETLAFQMVNDPVFHRWLIGNPGGRILCVTHAFREEYFAQSFLPSDGNAHASDKPQWLSREGVEQYAASLTGPLYAVGWGACRAPLQNSLDLHAAYAKGRANFISGKTMLDLSVLLEPTTRPVDPLYLKPARFEQIQPK